MGALTLQMSASVRWQTQPLLRLFFVCLILFAYGILEPMLDLKHSSVSHFFSESVFNIYKVLEVLVD